MTALEKMQELLPEMTYQEKIRLLQWIARELSDEFSGIESTPGICGGVARIAGTRIPVWALVQYKKLGGSDVDLLRAYPTIDAEDLANAWAYYRAHNTEIERQIIENETA